MSLWAKVKEKAKETVKEIQRRREKVELLSALSKSELFDLALEYEIVVSPKIPKDEMIGEMAKSKALTKRNIMRFMRETRDARKRVKRPKPKRPKKKRISKKEVKIEEEHIKEKITTEREIKRRIITAKEVTLNVVLGEVNDFKKRAPKIRGKRKERLYTTALTGFLAHTFPSIEMEQTLGKGTRIDAMVGKVGIEAKYRPDQNEINRLYGQIDTYLQFLNDIIVVFFDTSSGTVNDFKKKLKRGGYAKKVKVVNI